MQRSHPVRRFLLLGLWLAVIGSSMAAIQRQTAQYATAPGVYAFEYLLYLPPGYDADPSAAWPLMVFLHGAGERGTDIGMVAAHGPPLLIDQGHDFPCVVVSPQCSASWWDSAALEAFIHDLLASYRIDPDRVYLTGLSMGGYATWDLAVRHPGTYAAVVPVCGAGDPSLAYRLRDLPLWAFHGALDTTVPVAGTLDMITAIEQAGGNPRVTIYPDLGHDVWTITYASDGLYAWLFAQHRPDSPPVASPVVAMQPSSQTVAAGQSAMLTATGGGNPAPTYQWQRLAAGSTAWEDLDEGGNYRGTTTPTLTVDATIAAMSGDEFRCVFANGVYPDASSEAATLRVMTDAVLVRRLFLAVLGRDADAGALAGFGAALTAGRTPVEVLGDLLDSPEYALRRIEPTIRLYYAALARLPDYDGLRSWSQALQAGSLTLTQAADQFVASREFQLRQGTLDNTRFVEQLYRNVLGREADAAGLADWVARLDGGASRGTVLTGFSESDEFKGRLAGHVETVRLYFLLLRRMPAPAELRTGIDSLEGCGQTDTLFAQTYPAGLSDADYVQAVFRGFLRRDVTAGEQSTFCGALAAGTITRGSLVETVVDSAEFNLFVAPVSRLYLAALQRVPDQPGMDNWVDYLRAGASLQVMADAFATSREFLTRYGALDNQQYVAQLYRDVLGRDADADGLAWWTGLLDSGAMTRGQVLLGFSESQEAVPLYAPALRTFLHYFAFLDAAPTPQQLDYWKTYLGTVTAQLRQILLGDPAFTN